MKRAYFFLALVFSLSLFAACQHPEEKKPPLAIALSSPLIVAMGDSLTAGLGVAEEEAYPARLEAKLREAGNPARVINGGVSGETSSGALSRLDWLLTLQPAIVIVETGGNDGLRGIPPDLIARNIEAIVVRLQGAGVVVVLAGMKIHANMGSEYTQAFAALYEKVAEERGVIFVPFFLQGVAGVGNLMQGDAIHPNPAGHAQVVETIFPYIIEALKQVAAKQKKRA